MSINTFDVDAAKFFRVLGINQKQGIQRLAADLWNRITEKTPVDTGRARSAWDLTVGQPSTYLPAPGGIAAQAPDYDQIDGTDPVYIVNNLPYIERLENGYSLQAPAGMVRLSMAECEAEIELTMEGLDQ